MDYIEHSGHVVASAPLLAPLPDPDDQPFLEAALAGQAACLVTGNRAHFPPKPCRPIRILSPAEFLTFCRQQRKDP